MTTVTSRWQPRTAVGRRTIHLVGEHLTARGHDVVCPRLPSDTADAGQDEHLAAIEDSLRTRSDVILVAHSMSGLLAPLAAGHRAVGSLVLLAAVARELLGAGVREIDSGHSLFWSVPERLAELLVELA